MRIAAILDRASRLPLHRQIYEQWRKGILTGRFRKGNPMPSTRELATTLEVSRSTVSVAYEQLIAEGYLETAHGSGTFVCRELPLDPGRPRNGSTSAPPADLPIQLSRYGAGLTEDFRPPKPSPGVIRLSQRIPDLTHFPYQVWRKLMARHLRDQRAEHFDYAADSGGYAPLRSEIAAYLARCRGVQCSAEQVIIVNGSQQAIDLCVRLLLEPGDEAAVENPGYQGASRILAAYGVHLQPLGIDSDGVILEHLSKRAKLIYVTPSHQFPTGVSMSLARRLKLIERAREQGAVIIEDDYDSEYRYHGAPLPALQGLARGVPVIYIGTFSKVMFPGLRIGYLVVPRRLTPAFTRAKWLADRHTPVLEQAALSDFISEGSLERHIRRMRRLYGFRREALADSLRRHFGSRAKILGDAAGMHVMVRFEDDQIMERADRNGVELMSAGGYYLTDPPRGEFIFGFSAISERAICEGIRRLSPGPRRLP
jgi:GntR family transcriptional regulator/MocR family aminotransferase